MCFLRASEDSGTRTARCHHSGALGRRTGSEPRHGARSVRACVFPASGRRCHYVVVVVSRAKTQNSARSREKVPSSSDENSTAPYKTRAGQAPRNAFVPAESLQARGLAKIAEPTASARRYPHARAAIIAAAIVRTRQAVNKEVKGPEAGNGIMGTPSPPALRFLVLACVLRAWCGPSGRRCRSSLLGAKACLPSSVDISVKNDFAFSYVSHDSYSRSKMRNRCLTWNLSVLGDTILMCAVENSEATQRGTRAPRQKDETRKTKQKKKHNIGAKSSLEANNGQGV